MTLLYLGGPAGQGRATAFADAGRLGARALSFREMQLVRALALFTLAFTGRAGTVTRPLEAAIAIAAGPVSVGATREVLAAAVTECQEEIGAQFANRCVVQLFAAERERGRVYLPPYSIDRIEVTVAAYRACVAAGACSPEPLLSFDARLARDDLPISRVTFFEAERYCAFRGGRLPTGAEWERAARGRDGRIFPWGNVAERALSNHGRFATNEARGTVAPTLTRTDETDGFALLAPAGSFPRGASPEGVLDLAGNVAEWTTDLYSEDASPLPGVAASGALREVRGGSFRQPLVFQRTTARDGALPDTRSPEIGFRCVR
jgi:formylglycine-generating enzyme required for sulfatase activity